MVSHFLILEPESIDGCLWTHDTFPHVICLVICVLDEDFPISFARVRWPSDRIAPADWCNTSKSSIRSCQGLLNFSHSSVIQKSAIGAAWRRDINLRPERRITLAIGQLWYAGTCVSSKRALRVGVAIVTLFDGMDYRVSKDFVGLVK